MAVRLTVVLLLAAAGAADDLHLKDGRVLTGNVFEERGRYTVVDRDRKYAVPKAKVARVIKKSCFMDEYQKRRATLAKEDPETIYEFGVWVERSDWKSRAKLVYREVLRLDPEHRAARRALGYKLYEGAWVSPDELNRRKGLVKSEGRWYTPHELRAIKKELETNEKLRRALEHRRQVSRKVHRIVQGFATFDKKRRQRAYGELVRYAEQLNSPELRKFAADTKTYYDHLAKALCRKMMTRTEVNLTETELLRPVPSVNTNLGQAVALTPLPRPPSLVEVISPITIQLPQLAILEAHSTVAVPTGCK